MALIRVSNMVIESTLIQFGRWNTHNDLPVFEIHTNIGPMFFFTEDAQIAYADLVAAAEKHTTDAP